MGQTARSVVERSSRGTARREKILDAAKALFRERGFHATGIDDIGERAGVTGPAVYQYFDGKDEILAAIFEVALTDMRAAVDPIWNGKGKPKDRLEAMVREMVRQTLADRDTQIIYNREVLALSDERRDAFLAHRRPFVSLWCRALRGARPELSEGTARFLVHGMVGFIGTVGQHTSRLSAGDEVDVVTRQALALLLVATPPETSKERK